MTTTSRTKRGARTSFRCAAPEAAEVFLAGDFNAWSTTDTPMERSADGSWVVSLEFAPGRHEYKFVVDGQWVCEPGCDAPVEGQPRCVPNSFGTMNSIIEVE
jgi:1,4-alpha-glucan branching enzyme